MLIRALVDDFAENKYMSPPDASEEAAVAGLLGLNNDKPGESRKASKKQPAAEVASKAGKRSAPADGGDSATQTDSVTLTDGANDSREREVDSGCRNSSDIEPKQRKRQKSSVKVPSNKAASPEDEHASIPGSEGGNHNTPSSTVPFTLASAAQAAGVWNRSAARPLLPKMPTMTSATETNTPLAPSSTGHVTPFEGCEAGAVVKEGVEHADALHRESGADPISHDQQNSIAEQQHADLAAFLNESSTRTIPSEALQKLLQQCATGGQLSITDLVRACQQSSQPANATTADDATNATHTSTVSTMDIFPAHSSDTRATPHARDTRSHPQPDRDTDGTAACDTTAPVSANARSLFVQLSDAAAGNDAAKTALERTATPIVPRSAGPPPQMPMGVGATDAGGTHRTRSSSGGSRANRPTAQSLTPPLPAYRQHIGHAVPVTSHQKHKSDLLNNPDARSTLWFPEKSRNSKSKSKFPNNQKKAADNKQQGLAAERLQCDSAKSAAGGAQNLAEMANSLEMPAKPGSPQVEATQKPGYSQGEVTPITPERVHGLLSLVSQLAVFADGGVSGAWCRSLHNADCARARSLFRRALDLQSKSTSPSHLTPLLTAQANAAAAIAAFAATGSASIAHAMGAGSTIPVGLQAAAASAVAASVEAAQAAASSAAACVAAAGSSPSKHSPNRRSSAVTSAQ